ncbi:MAG: T9SS C-terminal target domain-containing protein [Bacteroidetes bacterium]|nr:MAG: T9SS C-terminal target domain-containing protein [Bacteroidota bacterium]
MKRSFLVSLSLIFFQILTGWSQTPVPNHDFEEWNIFPNYEDPVGWDTPNEEISSIPIFGTTLVTRSTDHYTGSYSARLESKSILLIGTIPGFMTCGTLTIDLATLSFEITGGAPVYDMPTHLKGYYRFFPQGGDSCAIGIGLFKTIDNTPYEVGIGSFSTKDTVPDWSYFSAWIDYDMILQPDTMNIIALSSATETPTAGSVLFVDNLFLDYTVGVDPQDPASGINIYNDQETKRLLVFLEFDRMEATRITLYSMTGQSLVMVSGEEMRNGKLVVPYDRLRQGIYILEVVHEGKRFVKKYFLIP